MFPCRALRSFSFLLFLSLGISDLHGMTKYIKSADVHNFSLCIFTKSVACAMVKSSKYARQIHMTGCDRHVSCPYPRNRRAANRPGALPKNGGACCGGAEVHRPGEKRLPCRPAARCRENKKEYEDYLLEAAAGGSVVRGSVNHTFAGARFLLDAGQCRRLQAQLLSIMDSEKDSLRFYYLGKQYEKKVEHFGAKSSYLPEDPLIL